MSPFIHWSNNGFVCWPNAWNIFLASVTGDSVCIKAFSVIV